MDQWLTAIRSLADPGTDMRSTGVDANGQRSAGQYVVGLPIMSAVACVKLAAGARPMVSVASGLE